MIRVSSSSSAATSAAMAIARASCATTWAWQPRCSRLQARFSGARCRARVGARITSRTHCAGLPGIRHSRTLSRSAARSSANARCAASGSAPRSAGTTSEACAKIARRTSLSMHQPSKRRQPWSRPVKRRGMPIRCRVSISASHWPHPGCQCVPSARPHCRAAPSSAPAAGLPSRKWWPPRSFARAAGNQCRPARGSAQVVELRVRRSTLLVAPRHHRIGASGKRHHLDALPASACTKGITRPSRSPSGALACT